MAAPEPAPGFAPPALPAAVELVTALNAARDDPSFFWAAVQRVMNDNSAAHDPGQALAELIFGLTSLAGILVQHLADATGTAPENVLGRLTTVYRGPSSR